MTKPSTGPRQASATTRFTRAVQSTVDAVRSPAVGRAADSAEAEHANLLREVHHRIKNNLQVLSSLLNLEANRASNPEVKRVTRILQDRLRAVALVHDQLHRSRTLKRVDLRAYVAAMLEGLEQAHGLEARGIGVRLRSPAITVGMTDALRVGLVLNELVSNAVSHGFPDERRGRIAVALARRAGGEIRLTVSNDGVPLPPGFQPPPDRLGLAIVGNIARNSGGRFWWTRHAGARFHVELRPS